MKRLLTRLAVRAVLAFVSPTAAYADGDHVSQGTIGSYYTCNGQLGGRHFPEFIKQVCPGLFGRTTCSWDEETGIYACLSARKEAKEPANECIEYSQEGAILKWVKCPVRKCLRTDGC